VYKNALKMHISLFVKHDKRVFRYASITNSELFRILSSIRLEVYAGKSYSTIYTPQDALVPTHVEPGRLRCLVNFVYCLLGRNLYLGS